MEVSCIVDLPDELVLCILDIVDDATFCALRLTHPCFNLYDDAQVERKRKVPHWTARDPRSCAHGALPAACACGLMASIALPMTTS